ncbi:MAG TPA: alpha/beta hydrolase [Acidimicrobiia bacterium]|nr:alpha/beta hydrolase [Acidimicrobiia bacterium]
MTEYLQTSSRLLHWKDYGGEGPPIVLVHGLGGSIANWDAIAPRLTELGRIVALDLPGFGLSPPAEDWRLETQAEALAGFVEANGTPASLVGNSLGGLLSEMVAAEHPEWVSALVLISPATPPRLPDPRLHWPTARRLALQAIPGVGRLLTKRFLRGHTPEELVRLGLELVTHYPERVSLEVIEELITLARIRTRLPWATEAVPSTATYIAKYFAKPSRFVSMIRKIKAPTLVIHGLEDQIVSPTAVEWVCSLRPDWDLVQMEDTGHVPQLDAPVRTLGVLRPWLEEHLERQVTA